MILDIILIVLLIAFGFIGYKVGFFSTLLKTASGISGLIVALVFSRSAADGAMQLGVADGLEITILDKVTSTTAYQTFLEAKDATEGLKLLLEDLGMPTFLANLITNSLGLSIDPDMVAQTIANSITYAIVLVVSFLALLLLCSLVFWVLKKTFNTMRKITVIRVVDGACGIVFYVFIYIVVVYILFFILQLILQGLPVDNAFAEFIFSQLHLEDDAFGLAKHFYENNVIGNIIGLIF